MADSKISALPASTVPLAGTEVLPIVQSSTTKQVSVANLTAGRTFDALGMTLTSTDAGATEGPLLDLYRDSASPTAADTLAEIQFNGEDSAGNKQKYACIHGSILSPTSGSEQGQIHFETQTAGASTEKMIIGTTNLVINEIGAVFNVRIEGDTDANLFYTDATNSRVGIGTVGPTAKLDVVGGDIRIDNGDLNIAASGKGVSFNGKLFKSSNAITLAGTDSTTMTFPSTSATIARTDAAQTFNGSQTFETASDNQVNIDATGSGAYSTINFKQGGVNKTNLFQEHGTTRFYIINSSGGVYLASGGVAWIAASDERKKDIIEPITNATNKVNQLRAVIGKYKTDAEGTRRSFLIAQDVQAVLPEAVDTTNPDVLGLSYSEIIPLLVAAIKEQTQEIEQLKLAIKGN